MANEVLVIDSSLAPDVAFERLIDMTRVIEWDRGIAGSTLVDGERGSVGARYNVALTGFDGQPTTASYEITAVGELTFTMVGSHADFRADDTVTVEPDSSGCKVTYDAGLVLLGDNPPVDDEQLGAIFAKLVAVVGTGLTTFLND